MLLLSLWTKISETWGHQPPGCVPYLQKTAWNCHFPKCLSIVPCHVSPNFYHRIAGFLHWRGRKLAFCIVSFPHWYKELCKGPNASEGISSKTRCTYKDSHKGPNDSEGSSSKSCCTLLLRVWEQRKFLCYCYHHELKYLRHINNCANVQMLQKVALQNLCCNLCYWVLSKSDMIRNNTT